MTTSFSIFSCQEMIQSKIKTESPKNYNSLDFGESFGISPLLMFQQKQSLQLSLLFLNCENQQKRNRKHSIKTKRIKNEKN